MVPPTRAGTGQDRRHIPSVWKLLHAGPQNTEACKFHPVLFCFVWQLANKSYRCRGETSLPLKNMGALPRKFVKWEGFGCSIPADFAGTAGGITSFPDPCAGPENTRPDNRE